MKCSCYLLHLVTRHIKTCSVDTCTNVHNNIDITSPGGLEVYKTQQDTARHILDATTTTLSFWQCHLAGVAETNRSGARLKTLSRCSFEKNKIFQCSKLIPANFFSERSYEALQQNVGGKETPAELGLGPHGAASATGCTRSFAVPPVRVLSLL